MSRVPMRPRIRSTSTRRVHRLPTLVIAACLLLIGLGAAHASVAPESRPVVTAVAPVSGPPRGGNTVVLTGSGFTGVSKVLFGTTPATSVTVLSRTSIRVTAPRRAAGTVSIRVLARAGTSLAAAGNRYTFVAAPQVTGLTPARGDVVGGNGVTVTGLRFVGVTQVMFGSARALSVRVISPTSLAVVAPPAVGAGRVDVRVTTSSGWSAISPAGQYTYVADGPVVEHVSPAAGPLEGGTTVTVAGVGLTGATEVLFGSSPAASFAVLSDTEISAVAPAAPVRGPVDVRVRTAAGLSPVSAAAAFTYLGPPTVTSLAPDWGPLEGGTVITIRGRDLAEVSGVTLGGVPASEVTATAPDTVSAVVPPSASPGPVDVVVSTPRGDSAAGPDARFTYVSPSPGTVLATGGEHTCALSGSGGVSCWGWNGHGQLGDGTTTARSLPVAVTGLETGVTAIAAAGATTCALKSDGELLCWGANVLGQLGDGSRVDRPVATQVPGVTDATAVAVGNGHVCAVSSTRGLLCWGWNHYGQLGDGTTTDRSAPTPVAGAPADVGALSAGDSHTCLLTSSGAAWCWGANSAGQLGTGTTSPSAQPAPVEGLGLGAQAISAGVLHTCAVRSGAAWCWGFNATGQVGDGGLSTRSRPTPVTGMGADATLVEADGYSCGVASGTVRCWGVNTFGGLGDGTTVARSAPVPVGGLPPTATTISVGNHHACAVDTPGNVWCWGDNAYGQVGDGTTVDRRSAVRVAP